MFHNMLIIVISVLLNAFAQLFIRKGMLLIGSLTLNIQNIVSLCFKVLTNIFLLSGMTCYAISILLWMVVLSRVNVSVAYPLLSIGYIVTAIMAYFLFGETLTLQKVAGIIVICIGVWLLTQTGELS
ncbi:SMR family transporter [Bacteroides nordii]|jgi:drug/metabolite transporter (DMT)-like permease